MKPSTLILLAALLCALNARAQQGTANIGGAAGAVLGTGVVFTDVQSAFTNQAGMAFVETLCATLFSQRRFMASELNDVAAGVVLPTSSGAFGVAVQHFGFSGYREQKFGLSYARRLFKRASVGAQMDYLAIGIPEYGMANVFTIELGAQVWLNERVMIGSHLYNPVRWQITDDVADVVPTVFSSGVLYAPASQVRMSAQILKDLQQPTSFRGGIEYQAARPLSFRVGFSTAPIQYAMGVGLRIRHLHLDLSTRFHQVLGITPGLSITYVAPARSKNSSD